MMRIAVLDDERPIRMGIAKIIRENLPDTIVIDEYSGAQHFLDAIDEAMPQLLITDIRMPGISGLELIRILYEKKYNIEVIVLSGYDDFEYCRTAIRYHVYDYILKPLDKKEFVRTLTQYISQKTHVTPMDPKGEQHFTVREIKKYLRHNYQNAVTMEQLGSHFCLNPNYISQLFKKETGIALFTYLTDLRMEMACIQLNDCTKRIAEISEAVGYSNPNRFSQAFKQKYGMTPSQFRKSRGVVENIGDDTEGT